MNDPSGSERTGASGAESPGDVALRVEIDEGDRMLVATVRGVIDFFSGGALEERVNTALDHGAAKLVLDLEAVVFVDSSGLALLISIQRRARAAGGWLRLVNPPSQLRRLLQTTNLDGHFSVYSTVDQATVAP